MTDRGIPEEMKTGFNLVEDDGRDVVENIASIVLVFMENAVKSADIYVKHSKRTTITSEDIKRGLMLEVFFMKQRPNMIEQCEQMKETIKKFKMKKMIATMRWKYMEMKMKYLKKVNALVLCVAV